MHKVTPYRIAQMQQKYSSARDMMRMLGLISLIASGAFWYPVQWTLVAPTTTPEMIVAIAFGSFIVLGPPVFLSFFVPWSPAARLISQINMKTAGQVVALAAMLFLVAYAGYLSFVWWSARPLVAEANLTSAQMMVGIIATIICPALMWAPASPEELEDILKQDRLVRRYRLQTEADIAICRAALLDAQTIASKGLLESIRMFGPDRVAFAIQNVLTGLDESIAGIAHQVSSLSNVYIDIPGFDNEGEDVRGILQYISDSSRETLEQAVRLPAPIPGATVSLMPHVEYSYAERELPREVAREREELPQRGVAAGSAPREIAPASDELDAYRVVWQRYGQAAWGRADIENVLQVKQTKALDLIRGWKEREWVGDVVDIKGRYQCVLAPEEMSL